MKINNKLLDEKSFICANCSANTNSTSTSTTTKLPLTNKRNFGNKFKLENNKIIANENCNVIIFAQLYITGGVTSASTGISINILKNGSEQFRSLSPVPSNWRTIPFPGNIIELSKGDYVEVGFVSGDKTGITCGSGNNSYITIIEI